MPKCNERKIYNSFIKTKRSFSVFHKKKKNSRYKRFHCLLYLPPGVLKILAILLSNSLTKSQKNVDIQFAHQKSEH